MSKKDKAKDLESVNVEALPAEVPISVEVVTEEVPPSVEVSAPAAAIRAPTPVQAKLVTNKSRKRLVVNTNTGRVLGLFYGVSAELLPGEEHSPEIVNNINLQVK